jgi:hypothetical protein
MSNRFDIGDVVSVNYPLVDLEFEPNYHLIVDIDFVLQKYITLLIGTNSTYTYTIHSMESNFYKVA